jgi:hypothetical protein
VKNYSFHKVLILNNTIVIITFNAHLSGQKLLVKIVDQRNITNCSLFRLNTFSCHFYHQVLATYGIFLPEFENVHAEVLS